MIQIDTFHFYEKNALKNSIKDVKINNPQDKRKTGRSYIF